MPTDYTIPLGPLDAVTPEAALTEAVGATLGVRVREVTNLVPDPSRPDGQPSRGYLVPQAASSLDVTACRARFDRPDVAGHLVVRAGTLVALDAETDTICLEAIWQVSNDNVTFYEVVAPTNAPPFSVATGTAGADATVTVALQAPDAVYGALYARVAVRNRFAIGTVNDTYVVGYNFAQSKEIA